MIKNKKHINLDHLFDGTNFYVGQLEPYGCSIACMAMLMNKTYSDIRNMWNNKNEGKNTGIAEYKRTSFLWQYGIVGHTEYSTEAHTQLKRSFSDWVVPFAPIHIVSCITSNGPHAIIWLKDGRVYDPNVKGVHSIIDYDVQEITGYWSLMNNCQVK